MITGRKLKTSRPRLRRSKVLATTWRGYRRYLYFTLLLFVTVLFRHRGRITLGIHTKASSCTKLTRGLQTMLFEMLGDRAYAQKVTQVFTNSGDCPNIQAISSSTLLSEQYRSNLVADGSRAKSALQKRRKANAFYTVTPRGFRYCNFPTVQKPHGDINLTVMFFLTPDLTDHPGYSNFRRSMWQKGYRNENIVQVMDHALPDFESVWLRRMKVYLNAMLKIPMHHVLCLLDGLDALVLKSPKELIDGYLEILDSAGKATQQTVIFGAEELCDTDSCVYAKVKGAFDSLAPSRTTRARYLNAGLSIGTVGAYVSLLTKAVDLMENNPRLDDQAAFATLFLSNLKEVQIVLDYDRKLFYNAPVDRPIAPKLLTEPQSLPAVIHFPGLRYEDNCDQKFNSCQRNLLASYNSVLGWLEPSKSALHNKGLSQKSLDVIVSLTTTPARIDNLLPTINSLLVQTLTPRHILLNVPKRSKRFDTSYVVPAYLYNIPGVVINRCHDYGPASKLLGALDRYKDPNTIIITVDDEYMYPANLVETLVAAHEVNQHAAFGFAGQIIDADYTSEHRIDVRSADQWNDAKYASVDVLEGFLGALYKVDFFSASIYDISDACRTTDDIWFSAHLAASGIPRIKLSMTFSRPSDTETGNDKRSNLRSSNVEGEKANIKCAASLLPIFQLGWATNAIEPCSQTYVPLTMGNIPYFSLNDNVHPAWVRQKHAISPCSAHFFKADFETWTGQIVLHSNFYIASAAGNAFFLLQSDGNLCAKLASSPFDLTYKESNNCLFSYSLIKQEVPLRVSHAKLNSVAGTIEVYGRFADAAVENSDQQMYLMQSLKVCKFGAEGVSNIISVEPMMAIRIFDEAGSIPRLEVRCQLGAKWTTFLELRK